MGHMTPPGMTAAEAAAALAPKAAPVAPAPILKPVTRAQESEGGHPVKPVVKTTSSQQNVPGYGGKSG